MNRLCPKCGKRTAEVRCPDDSTATLVLVANPDARLVEGAEVNGRYRVGALIGQGGFGAVYRAKNLATDQDIALKLLAVSLDQGDSDVILRFFAEAQVTASLKHPNTIRVFDFGQTEGGALYIAMELLTGRPLNEELRDRLQHGRSFTQDEVIVIGSQVLRSLAEAHAANLVHRDLKPHNIFLHTVEGDDPVVKVLDFGIAKRLGSNLTGTGKAFGTPTYMSPEQAQNRPLDRRSDLYSLGCVLYQLVAGRPPFDGENPLAVLLAHVTDPPPELRRLAWSQVSDQLVGVIQRALAKNPDARFASAIEMRQALESCRGSAATVTPAFTHPLTAPAAWSEPTAGYDVSAAEAAQTAAYEPHAAPQDPPPPPSGVAPLTSWMQPAPALAQPVQAVAQPVQEELDEEEATASPSRPWYKRGVVLAGAVLALAAGAAWMMRPVTTAAPATAPASEAGGSLAIAADAVATDVGLQADATSAAAPGAPVVIQLQTEPSGAVVRLGGKESGKTPLAVTFPVGQAVQHAELQLDGYVSQTVQLAAADAPARTVTLVAVAKPTAKSSSGGAAASASRPREEPKKEEAVRPKSQSGSQRPPATPAPANPLEERL